MVRENDTVVLTHDIEEHSLKQGDVGALVHWYGDGKAVEVEFVTAGGNTIGVTAHPTGDVRPMRNMDMHLTQPCPRCCGE